MINLRNLSIGANVSKDKIKVLKDFPFRGKQYPKGGYIFKKKFTEIELNSLATMGFIDYTKPKPKPKSPTNKKDSGKESKKDK